jgi:hypothetical protein
MGKTIREWLAELRPHFIFWIIAPLLDGLYSYLRAQPAAIFEAFLAGVVVTALGDAGIRWFSVRDQPRPASTASNADGSIRILPRNSAILTDIKTVLGQKGGSIGRVIIVQYSGVNITNIVDEIRLHTNADIELFLADPSRAINDHQAVRIQERLDKLSNDLDTHARGTGVVDVYTYEAPAAVRAVLISGRMLYIGAYYYKVMPISEPKFDIRGGEMPLLAVPSNHQDFEVLSREIVDMVDNWKQHGKAVLKESIRKAIT